MARVWYDTVVWLHRWEMPRAPLGGSSRTRHSVVAGRHGVGYCLMLLWFGFVSGFGFGLFWYNVGVVCPWLSVGGSGYCTGPKSIIL